MHVLHRREAGKVTEAIHSKGSCSVCFSALQFLESFYVTITREWHGIDRLRLDKFYMVRLEVHTLHWKGSTSYIHPLSAHSQSCPPFLSTPEGQWMGQNVRLHEYTVVLRTPIIISTKCCM